MDSGADRAITEMLLRLRGVMSKLGPIQRYPSNRLKSNPQTFIDACAMLDVDIGDFEKYLATVA